MPKPTSPHLKPTKINTAQFITGVPENSPGTPVELETLVVVVKFKGLPTVVVDFLDESLNKDEAEDMVQNLPVVLSQTYAELTSKW